MQPLVSICMPVYNGADVVSRSVQSALAQDYPNIEVVVVDDASQDETVEVLRGRFADSIRLERNEANLGAPRTTNASVAHSRGSLIKFLHQDDGLERDCVPKMVESLRVNDSAGMVFGRRRIEVEAETPATADWVERYGELHLGFSSLEPVNPGLRLLREVVSGGFENLVGEPSCVMVRRECLDRLGGLNPRIHQIHDLELWLRIMTSYDVAFIDEQLAAYRHSPDSLTGSVKGQRRDWLDRLWILEMLMSHEEVRYAVPEVEGLWRAERRMAFRTVARHALRPRPDDPPVGLWRAYVSQRVRRLFGIEDRGFVDHISERAS